MASSHPFPDETQERPEVPAALGRGVVAGAPMTADARVRLKIDAQTSDEPKQRKGISLAFRLLLMTLGFVMLAEALIFMPSIGRAQRDYLEQRLAFGHLAILSLDAAPDGMVGDSMREQLLSHADADLIALRRDDGANRVLRNSDIYRVERQLILTETSWYESIGSALKTLSTEAKGRIRIVGLSPREENATVEVVIMAAPLKAHLSNFGFRILWLSLVISAISAALIYLTLILFIVRPVERLTKNMRQFARDPLDQSHEPLLSDREDELGEAERSFAAMRQTVRQAFHQKTRLAALGTGLTKITHDLRNVMSTTILLSDGLETSKDPMVQRVAPRLSAEIGRAEALCLATVTYATEGPVQLSLDQADLAALTETVAERLRDDTTEISVTFDSAPLMRLIDASQIDRVLDNLMRNAKQMGARNIDVSQRFERGQVFISLKDNGPGMPPRAMEHLFSPFAGSARKGGTGLGLPLSRDLMRAHGGELELIWTEMGEGTEFLLRFPAG